MPMKQSGCLWMTQTVMPHTICKGYAWHAYFQARASFILFHCVCVLAFKSVFRFKIPTIQERYPDNHFGTNQIRCKSQVSSRSTFERGVALAYAPNNKRNLFQPMVNGSVWNFSCFHIANIMCWIVILFWAWKIPSNRFCPLLFNKSGKMHMALA